MKNSHQLFGVFALSIFLAATTQASVIYTYTGNTFNSYPAPYDSTMSVSVVLELNSVIPANQSTLAITPLSFSFSDGVNTITNINSTSSDFIFSTNIAGDIYYWNVVAEKDYPSPTSIGDELHGILSSSNIDLGVTEICLSTDGTNCTGNSSAVAEVSGSPGSWSVTTIPIPATVWLFGSGLLGLIGMAKRK